jgi:hypothetical protein
MLTMEADTIKTSVMAMSFAYIFFTIHHPGIIFVLSSKQATQQPSPLWFLLLLRLFFLRLLLLRHCGFLPLCQPPG